MKHFTLLIAILLTFAATTQAQILYSVDFESGMPGNITLIDNDGLTPHANVAAYTAAWNVANPGNFGNGTNIAISTSWFTSPGTADDWMILPAQAIQPGTILEWEAMAQDGSYPDGYEVWVGGGPSVGDMLAGTMVFSTPAENNAWTPRIADLNAFAGQNVFVGFRNNSTDQFLLLLDNIVMRVPLVLDGGITRAATTSGDFIAPGNVTVEGTIKNNGINPITSFDISYKVNGGASVSQSFTGLNITTSQTYDFTHNTAFAAASGVQNIDVILSNVNGQADDDPNNDAAVAITSVVTNSAAKKVILADHSGAWCQFCPDGTVVLDGILNDLTLGAQTIGVTVHNGDAMAITDGEALNSAYVAGFPSGSIDFVLFDGEADVAVNRGTWGSRVLERTQALNPVSVSIDNVTWNASTREITVTVKGDFTSGTGGDWRFNAYILENKVTGSGSGYDQVNAYNTQSGHAYFGAGNPIVGFEHNHTLRAMLGGAWGEQGSLPASIADNSSHTHTFTHTLPADQDYQQIHIVGLIQKGSDDPNDRYVLSADEVQLTTAVNTKPLFEEAASVNIFPNPASTQMTMELYLKENGDVTIDLVTLQGQVVENIENGFMGSGHHTVNWGIGQNIPNGMYLMRIKVGEYVTMKKVSVVR